jgi:hypothetical protein
VVRDSPWIDPGDLLVAVDSVCQTDPADYRTKLLARESLMALQERWGNGRLMDRLSSQARRRAIELMNNDPGEVGFPTLRRRMRDRTEPQTVLSFFRELGADLTEPSRLEVGGSIALILGDLLRRGTDDIDVVDEVPANLRNQHELLSRLAQRHGLQLTHFQSHYLPAGYANRLQFLDRFRLLDVYLVDPLDILVGKLFSRRDKDLDDLRILKNRFSSEAIVERIRASAAGFLADAQLKQNARRNWYILFGEELPVG